MFTYLKAGVDPTIEIFCISNIYQGRAFPSLSCCMMKVFVNWLVVVVVVRVGVPVHKNVGAHILDFLNDDKLRKEVLMIYFGIYTQTDKEFEVVKYTAAVSVMNCGSSFILYIIPTVICTLISYLRRSIN